MKQYGFDEIQQMQQKALERVQSMKIQAQQALEDSEPTHTEVQSAAPKGHIPMPVNLPSAKQSPPAEIPAADKNILDGLLDEPDKALLMSLLLLFKGDKRNEELLMALIYIML